jgi:hypothetical protein
LSAAENVQTPEPGRIPALRQARCPPLPEWLRRLSGDTVASPVLRGGRGWFSRLSRRGPKGASPPPVQV